MPMRSIAALLAACLLAVGCRTGTNYLSPDGPRYAGGTPSTPAAEQADTGADTRVDTLHVVTFNIAFSRHVDAAVAILADSAMPDADVLLLQEMTEEGTRRVADALGLAYVYYPAIFHKRARRQFGNAVLSRWPIVEDAKLRLPHRSRYGGSQRIATAATIRVRGTEVRVYSTHLGTVADIGRGARRDQLRAVLADAARYPRVVIGGDMNDGAVGRVVRDAGYAWPTERGPHTTRFGRWDHVFLKGLAVPEGVAAGTGPDPRGASDHRPVWAVAVVR